jgi:hypothetical protein
MLDPSRISLAKRLFGRSKLAHLCNIGRHATNLARRHETFCIVHCARFDCRRRKTFATALADLVRACGHE